MIDNRYYEKLGSTYILLLLLLGLFDHYIVVFKGRNKGLLFLSAKTRSYHEGRKEIDER